MRVAPTNLTVLITGESGAGKEVFSQIIHALSPRKHNTLIAVNSGAIPEGTINSELFGHEKGAFTGATEKRKGYFETANGGSLFLDEVGEIPLGTQARLLRVLETGEYIKVGSSKAQKTDVRLIAATNKDLMEDIRLGKFREDLYYRLGTVPIKVPSLRERPEDIHLLFRKFATDFSTKYRTKNIRLTADAKQLLLEYPWPGNVREVKNIAEQISVLATEETIDRQMLLSFLPKNNINHLPAVLNSNGSSQNGSDSFSEREILYKIMFDMKNDISDLKKVLFQIVQTGGGNVQNSKLAKEFVAQYENENDKAFAITSNENNYTTTPQKAMYVNDNIEEHQVVEESLSIADKEQELIKKALVKHKGKRKDAALDLGISERTLYRKIKEYSIEE